MFLVLTCPGKDGEVVVDLVLEGSKEAEELEADKAGGLIGLKRGELDEAICRSIEAADSSSGVSTSGVGGVDDGGGRDPNDPETDAGDLRSDLDMVGDLVAEEDEVVVVAPGPKLRKGTCVEVYIRIGSKQCVEGGGEGRYEEGVEVALDVEGLSRGE